MNGADSLRGDGQDEHTDRPSGSGLPVLRRLVWLLYALLSLGSLATAATGDGPGPLLVDGYQIPAFATAEEQLSYARSTFAEAGEKSAALKAVGNIHPSAREQTALAALELAFLALGDDYRLAGRDQYLLAGSSYQAVLEQYADMPAIAAKALWYLGWIACDLEADTERGTGWYRRLIALYPEEKLSIVAPPPWLTLRPAAPDSTQPGVSLQIALTWADIAHLELIRHAASRDQAWQSFAAIEAGADRVFAAGALKVLIERHGFDGQSERLAREYIAQPGADLILRNDLLLALSRQRRQTEQPGGPP